MYEFTFIHYIKYIIFRETGMLLWNNQTNQTNVKLYHLKEHFSTKFLHLLLSIQQNQLGFLHKKFLVFGQSNPLRNFYLMLAVIIVNQWLTNHGSIHFNLSLLPPESIKRAKLTSHTKHALNFGEKDRNSWTRTKQYEEHSINFSKKHCYIYHWLHTISQCLFAQWVGGGAGVIVAGSR